MWMIVGTIGILGLIVSLLGTLFLVVKRNPSWKKWLISAGICLFLCLVGLVNDSPSEVTEVNEYPSAKSHEAQTSEQQATVASESSEVISTGCQIKVHFIDVGQADSIYIQLPDRNDVLIDGGNVADGQTVVNYLKAQGVDDIELMIATHPHEDHIGGLADVFDAFKVDKVIDSGIAQTNDVYRAYMAKVKVEGCVYEVNNKQTLIWGNTVLKIFTGYQPRLDLNNVSVVSQLDTGDIEFLFMGDAGNIAEPLLRGDLSSDILKVGHHGSYSSSTISFRSRVAPKVAVISVGADNDNGHPFPATLARIEAKGATIYRTDLNGNIVVTTDGNIYSVATDRDLAVPVQPVVATKPILPAQSEGVYVGSKNSHKYHYPDCSGAKQIKEENKIWFNSTTDAATSGYTSCAICRP